MLRLRLAHVPLHPSAHEYEHLRLVRIVDLLAMRQLNQRVNNPQYGMQRQQIAL